ncbi:hypothetical protein B0A55_09013 [Friedmanniomyces simplex]|uniref:Uncharacterized protein n=1 Tax=Friedmanniomyces simplex TaxID=329884 RepID=A0A4U0WQM6_9PEZI|nr:hypothetical protein B0A55_09013 [Friedmanniomyces simplex]
MTKLAPIHAFAVSAPLTALAVELDPDPVKPRRRKVLLLTAPEVCPASSVPFEVPLAAARVPFRSTADDQEEYAEAEADAQAEEIDVMFADAPAAAVADVHAPDE